MPLINPILVHSRFGGEAAAATATTKAQEAAAASERAVLAAASLSTDGGAPDTDVVSLTYGASPYVPTAIVGPAARGQTLLISATVSATNTSGSTATAEAYIDRVGDGNAAPVSVSVADGATEVINLAWERSGVTLGDEKPIRVLVHSVSGVQTFDFVVTLTVTHLRDMEVVRVARLGDSYTENGFNSTLRTSLCYGTYAEIALDGAIRAPRDLNFGVSSERIDQIALRVGDVINAAPDVCLLPVGVNNLLQDTSETGAQLLSGILGIADALADAGIRPILFTLVAMNKYLENGGARETRRLELNDLIRRQGRYRVADPAALFDPLYGADPQGLGGSYDGEHPHAVGVQMFGLTAAGALRPVLPDALPGTDRGTFTVDGTGGTAGAGVSGSVATDWTVNGPSGTVALGAGARTVLDGVTDLAILSARKAVIRVDAGRDVWIDVDLRADLDTGVTALRLRGDLYDAGQASVGVDQTLVPRGVEGTPQAAHRIDGTVCIGPITPSAAAAFADVRIEVQGAGRARVEVRSVAVRVSAA